MNGDALALDYSKTWLALQLVPDPLDHIAPRIHFYVAV
jgi:hypothetical protein